MNKSIAGMFGLVALVACSSTPDPAQQTASVPRETSRAPTLPNSSSAASRAPSAAQTPGAAVAARNPIPQQNSVYFDYDSSVVKDDYRSVVTGHARYLSEHRRNNVRVEGNTDERGSREYNLALGQRRAEAVKQQLTLLGVPPDRIESMSFGEEKPRAEGESESAYSQNRRADITYATP